MAQLQQLDGRKVKIVGKTCMASKRKKGAKGAK
jgi:hypothetical protein